jgi:acyl-CoA oxidase
LGTSANYAIVMAQLITPDGVRRGPHAFIVQLRDRSTHKPCPGVEVGDIGPKLSFASNDNGYLRLHNVRIPREHMLMRNAQVLPGGEYVPPSHDKLNFGTMVFVRSVMIADQAVMLSKAVTIAVRYSCVRRQGQIDVRCVRVHVVRIREMCYSQGEVQVLDYQSQQYRILPSLAAAFAYFLVGKQMMAIYESATQAVLGGQTDVLPEVCAHACILLRTCTAPRTVVGAKSGVHVGRCHGHRTVPTRLRWSWLCTLKRFARIVRHCRGRVYVRGR